MAIHPMTSFVLVFAALLLLSCSTAMSTNPATPSSSSAASRINRCAVVGVGVLGTSLCRQILEDWKQADDDDDDMFNSVVVTGITKTANNHDAIRAHLGSGGGDRVRLVTASDLSSSTDVKFQNVVFCAPPSGFEDYPAAVKEALEKYWAGPDSGGVFVFTSSGAVYGPGDSVTVTEKCALADAASSPRVARLVNVEKACLEAGGCCLRLAGLYTLQRGPHNYWITSGKGIDSAPDGLINMLHYDDAASACLAALKAGPAVCRGQAFLISDGHPISRYGICVSALKADAYKGYSMPEFTGGNDQPLALGKIYDGSASNSALQWFPKYKSFDDFMEANA